MSTPHRDVVNQLAAWIVDEVPAASGWTFYVEEPITLPEEPACAVWWERGDPLPEENTTGWIGTIDTYGIRFTEPASSNSGLLRDEDEESSLEADMEAVVATLFNHTADLPASNHDMRWGGYSKLPTSNDFLFAGWEITVFVRRQVSFT